MATESGKDVKEGRKKKREFAKNQAVKLFVYDKNDNTGTTLYFAKLSN